MREKYSKETPRSPLGAQKAPRRHPGPPRRHPDHQGGQGRLKTDESMKNMKKLMVFTNFGAAHRADVAKTLCFPMFLKEILKKPCVFLCF